jgi:hypothetical protein
MTAQEKAQEELERIIKDWSDNWHISENKELQATEEIWLEGYYPSFKLLAQAILKDYVRRDSVEKVDIIHNDITPELVEQNFPKGQCKERGQAILLHAQMLIAIQQIINDALAQIKSEIKKIIEAHPNVSFKLKLNAKEKFIWLTAIQEYKEAMLKKLEEI